MLNTLKTLREGERVCRSPHPPLTRSPFPEKTEWRVKSGEWSFNIASEARLVISSVRIHQDLIHRKRSPFPYEGKA